jgi:hypothetical protein
MQNCNYSRLRCPHTSASNVPSIVTCPMVSVTYTDEVRSSTCTAMQSVGSSSGDTNRTSSTRNRPGFPPQRLRTISSCSSAICANLFVQHPQPQRPELISSLCWCRRREMQVPMEIDRYIKGVHASGCAPVKNTRPKTCCFRCRCDPVDWVEVTREKCVVLTRRAAQRVNTHTFSASRDGSRLARLFYVAAASISAAAGAAAAATTAAAAAAAPWLWHNSVHQGSAGRSRCSCASRDFGCNLDLGLFSLDPN